MPPRPPSTQRSGSQTAGAPVGGWSLALVSRRKETQPTGLLPSGRKSDFYSLCYPQKPRRAAAPPAHSAHPAPIPRAVCHLPSVLRLRHPSLGSAPSKTGHRAPVLRTSEAGGPLPAAPAAGHSLPSLSPKSLRQHGMPFSHLFQDLPQRSPPGQRTGQGWQEHAPPPALRASQQQSRVQTAEAEGRHPRVGDTGWGAGDSPWPGPDLAPTRAAERLGAGEPHRAGARRAGARRALCALCSSRKGKCAGAESTAWGPEDQRALGHGALRSPGPGSDLPWLHAEALALSADKQKLEVLGSLPTSITYFSPLLLLLLVSSPPSAFPFSPPPPVASLQPVA